MLLSVNLILFLFFFQGVRSTGAAITDPLRSIAAITIQGGNNPRGVFAFDASALATSVPPSNATIWLMVDRMRGAIGQY